MSLPVTFLHAIFQTESLSTEDSGGFAWDKIGLLGELFLNLRLIFGENNCQQ